jgi:hypothetical protein
VDRKNMMNLIVAFHNFANTPKNKGMVNMGGKHKWY